MEPKEQRPSGAIEITRDPAVRGPVPAGSAEADAARRALEQTREAIKSGELTRVGEQAVRALEQSLAGKPEAGDPGEVVVRVVAVGDRREGVPSVPLGGLTVRLNVENKPIAEKVTDPRGLAALPLGDIADAAYEVEVLGADCAPIACQPGRIQRKAGVETHLIELPRTEALKPQLERALPLEDAVRAARARADVAARVMQQALAEQEKQLVEFLAEIEKRPALPRLDEDKPIEKPSGEKPPDRPPDRPPEKPPEKPREKPAEKPEENPTEKPPQKPRPSKDSRTVTTPKSRLVKPPDKRGK
jgi:hypothetical protein